MATTALICPHTKASSAGRKEVDGKWDFFPNVTLILHPKGKSFIEVTRRLPHIFHWPYISLGHMPILWQRRMRFRKAIRTNHYSASRLCTLPFSQNLGSSSMREIGNGCWVDNLDFRHVHSSNKSFLHVSGVPKGPIGC